MKKFLFSCLLIFGFTNLANAIPLMVDEGTWTPFFFNNTDWVQPPSLEFTLTGPANLQVTDVFESGDEFLVTITDDLTNTVLQQGPTSAVSTIAALNILDDYDAAFADAGWSSASFLLGPGMYSITGGVTRRSPVMTAGDTGQGGIRVDTVTTSIPEPASIWLSLMGLSGLLFLTRKSVQQR